METLEDKKLELSYPCSWSYRVISTKSSLIECAVEQILGERECSLVHSNSSSGGKYVSMNLELLVHSDDDREVIFEELKKHKDIKMVL
ncbi:MAG: DUF493 domain-containing protein [Sulfuricurvum sp.]